MKRKNKITVAVAMSGGVDSSVAAYLLKKQGYQVIGLTMELVPCGRQKIGGCCGSEAIESARRVCQKLDIPHYVLNFRKQFKEKIIDNFCQEYLAGRTPNPCVLCNQDIKFDLLLKRAREIGADYLATGHYVRLRRTKLKISTRGGSAFGGKNEKLKTTIKNSKFIYQLLKGKDKEKDQSYFLYRLTQEQLKYVLFPLADLTKKQARQIAKKAKLAAAERPESQEICFIPDNDYRRFLRENCLPRRIRQLAEKAGGQKIKPGPILDKNNKIIGQHQGIAFYTIGQRKGLRINSTKPLYVIKIDKKKNALIVGGEKDLYLKECLVKEVNWISGQAPKLPLKAMVKIRYKHLFSLAEINHSLIRANMPLVVIKFQKPQRAITPGQSAVFYSGEKVLGGGIIF